MSWGYSFGRIKFLDNDTIFSISYNGTVRFIINKTIGTVTIGAVDGTGVNAIVANLFEGATVKANDNLLVNASTGASEQCYIEGDSKLTGYLLMSGGAGAYLQVPSLTTTQRDALTPSAGMIIYNATTAKHQGYGGLGTWADLY